MDYENEGKTALPLEFLDDLLEGCLHAALSHRQLHLAYVQQKALWLLSPLSCIESITLGSNPGVLHMGIVVFSLCICHKGDSAKLSGRSECSNTAF
jgi:hypothetical protein